MQTKKAIQVLLAESLYKEIMAENFANMGKDMDIQVHESQKTPTKFNQKISLIYITVKMSKDKVQIGI